jgi:thymidine kinase
MELILLGKTVIVSALSGTYKMEPFENISFLISKADKIKFKKSICQFCQENNAPFTLRTIPNNDLILVGAADCYKSACRKCYIQNHVF